MINILILFPITVSEPSNPKLLHFVNSGTLLIFQWTKLGPTNFTQTETGKYYLHDDQVYSKEGLARVPMTSTNFGYFV